MSVVEALARGEKLNSACHYCGAGREYRGHRFPPDDCCAPRAVEQLAWMTSYLAKPENARRNDDEVASLRETASHLRNRLAEWERGEPGIVRYAASMVAEKWGEASERARQARQVAAGLERLARGSR